ncbi:hypothetical protein SUGI_0815520 [Cryptomeria japonica]|uniref:cell wall integrity and stress response component 4 n=1 Tax=Cryptomeria japonica TaxID=3369 RepID=UPI00241477F5|nr:cell wall integrity and stress response component 4 [Cryptomeria japonica]GLJ39876.1 hypothetical protein SUGI_0815520 [Cryptomeria japonica]
MNPESSESVNPLLDIDSWLDFCQSRGGLMEDHLDTELMNIINSNNNHHRGHMSPSRPSSMTMHMKQNHNSYDLSSLMNSAEATSVTTMAMPRSFINIPTNSSSAKSSNITSGTTPSTGLQGRPNATGNGAVKVKKKRVRASRRVPTTVLRTDTSNFKAMVQHFTGIPVDTSSSSSSPTTTATTNPSSSEPPFTKPLPHPAVCKIPPSTQNKPSTSSAAATAATSASNDGEQHSLSLPSSFSSQSVHDISSPLLSPNVFTPDPANNDIPEEQTMSMSMSAMDAAFFEKLWS